MLQWTCRVIRKNRLRDEYVRGKLMVTNLASTVQNVRLRRFGHVLRRIREKKSDANLCAERTKSVRSMERWKELVEEELRLKGLIVDAVQNRVK